jgi:hypothetical protein
MLITTNSHGASCESLPLSPLQLFHPFTLATLATRYAHIGSRQNQLTYRNNLVAQTAVTKLSSLFIVMSPLHSLTLTPLLC